MRYARAHEAQLFLDWCVGNVLFWNGVADVQINLSAHELLRSSTVIRPISKLPLHVCASNPLSVHVKADLHQRFACTKRVRINSELLKRKKSPKLLCHLSQCHPPHTCSEAPARASWPIVLPIPSFISIALPRLRLFSQLVKIDAPFGSIIGDF